MKYVITLILVCIAIITGVISITGTKQVGSKIDLQVQSINEQISDFETMYNMNRDIGEQYLNTIVDVCLKNEITSEFEAIYNPSFDEHYGEINFCKAIKNNEPWDLYSSYCNRYAESKGITVQEIWSKVDAFNNKYDAMDDTERYNAVQLLDFSENFGDFKYNKPKVEMVDYFSSVGSDSVSQLIQIFCNRGMNKLTIEVLWRNGKIDYIVRRV